jgi:hypothetical protein
MRVYSVASPAFNHLSGGVRVMYGLYGWLLIKGQIAYLNEHPNTTTDYIAIYPEIVRGNPFGADHVVRYILNKPGLVSAIYLSGKHETGPTEFPPTDNLYVFSELFNTMKVDSKHHMFLPILDLHLWKDQGKKRTKRAVFVGKGDNLNLHPADCTIITRQMCSDQQWLADVLNECEVVYQYDPVTAMSEIARLCGCRIVYLAKEYSREDYLNGYEPGINGMSFGEDQEIPLDAEGFREHYIGLRRDFSKKLEIFIEETQSCQKS